MIYRLSSYDHIKHGIQTTILSAYNTGTPREFKFSNYWKVSGKHFDNVTFSILIVNNWLLEPWGGMSNTFETFVNVKKKNDALI